jgi:hypothetical protein
LVCGESAKMLGILVLESIKSHYTPQNALQMLPYFWEIFQGFQVFVKIIEQIQIILTK